MQTNEDYGFERAFTPFNRSMLLGLYRGLILLSEELEPMTVHRWRVKGTLIEEIKAFYESLSADNRGGYYPWFLQNQWVLARSIPPPPDASLHSMLITGWQYAGGSASATIEEINAIRATWPRSKQQCFSFCTVILCGWHPRPDNAIWIHFGFCVCENEHTEGPLSRLYSALMAECTFHEIYTAYDSSSLVALIDSKGLRHAREQILHLDDVLAGSPRVNKSVWDLKQYTAVKEGVVIPSVAVDYGFVNCNGEGEEQELKEVYEEFFRGFYSFRGADPIELHEAAIGGRLYDYVGRFVKLQQKFKYIMKNPYPLPMH